MIDIKSLEDETGILITKKAIDAGVTKSALYSYLKKNNYEQIAHGIYASPDCFADELFVLSLRCPAGVISHDEALYHYGLIDREPVKHTITVYSGYGTARLREDNIKVYTINRDLLETGKTEVKTNLGHTVSMYDLERTICDMVRSRNSIDIQDYQTALKSYIQRKDKDLNKLMKYAKLFHVDKKLREYMGVLL